MKDSCVIEAIEAISPPWVRRGARASAWAESRLFPVLAPPSWMYAAAVSAVRALRSRAQSKPPSGLRVLSIGNLEVGGGGKTPFAVYVLERLAGLGVRAIYVSRGFGGLASGMDVVTVIPGEGDESARWLRSGVRVIDRGSLGSFDLSLQVGDEGAMVVRRLPKTTALFCREKRLSLDIAAAVGVATHAVMDDAFQSWGVPRDIDVVLLDRDRPFGNGYTLPAGRLRERPDALRRADFVGINGAEAEDDLGPMAAIVERRAGSRKPIFGIRRSLEMRSADGSPAELSGPVAVLSGIAKPESFERQVVGYGGQVLSSFRFPDHHRYGRRDVEWVAREAARRGIVRVVTTEKDWAKLCELEELEEPLDRPLVARLRLEIFGEDPIPQITRAAG
jgi:tetraacyldisaccharide-1-P 4'-kinase